MTSFNFKIAEGKNRALVCYCATEDVETFKNAVLTVLNNQGIDIAPFIDDGTETVWTIANAIRFTFDDPAPDLSIALSYDETAKRLRVGGSFETVCVGLFLYDQPQTTPQPEPGPDEEPDEEPEPAPSITSLVCDALREAIGGTFGASAFVIPSEVTEFTLEVE